MTDYLVAQTELSKYPEERFNQVLATSDVIPGFVRRFEAWLALDARLDDPVFFPGDGWPRSKPRSLRRARRRPYKNGPSRERT